MICLFVQGYPVTETETIVMIGGMNGWDCYLFLGENVRDLWTVCFIEDHQLFDNEVRLDW